MYWGRGRAVGALDGSRVAFLLAALVCYVVYLERSITVSAAQLQQVQAKEDGPGYAITGFQIEVVKRPSGLPDLQEVARAFGELEVTLANACETRRPL